MPIMSTYIAKISKTMATDREDIQTITVLKTNFLMTFTDMKLVVTELLVKRENCVMWY